MGKNLVILALIGILGYLGTGRYLAYVDNLENQALCIEGDGKWVDGECRLSMYENLEAI